MTNTQPRRRRIGSVETLFVEGTADAPTIIFFHGYGADMNDLAPLARAIQAPKGTNWVFPNGHISVPLGEHVEGRAWFPISVSDQQKMMAGQALDFSELVPPGMKRAREAGRELVKGLGVDAKKLVLGGFSQGAMLATELALELDTPPAGLAILSGTLLNATEWTRKAQELVARKPGFQFFQCHGKFDQVLSLQMAQKLEQTFVSAGWSGRLMSFDGAHEIPPEVIIQVGAYLRKVLA